MVEKTPINARLPAEIVRHARAEAKARGMTLTDFLEYTLRSYQTETGPGAAGKEIRQLKAVIAEQERIVRRHTGKPTPTKRRVTISIPVEDIQTIDAQARQAGMTRPEFIRTCLVGQPRRRILKAEPTTPALPV